MVNYSYRIGLVALDSLTGIVSKVLVITSGGAIANNGIVVGKINGAAYAVTAGKQFIPTEIKIFNITTASAALSLIYADDAALTTNIVNMGVTAPALVGAAGLFTVPLSIPCAGATPAPATKYVGVKNLSGGTTTSEWDALIIGYEI